MKSLTWVVVLILILIGAFWLIQGAGSAPVAQDLGTYAYACDNGAEFNMTPASDVSSILITPSTNAAFAETTLVAASSSAGARFEGDGLIFVGAGEGVTLTVASSTVICQPKPNPDSPPWNWGDAGEGAGAQQDASLALNDGLLGTWQSTEDAKFSREFLADGKVTDWYEGKALSMGMWEPFTKVKPLTTSFPLEEGALYVQIRMATPTKENLNFKLAKLTPEELELIYMERGGTLKFKRVK